MRRPAQSGTCCAISTAMTAGIPRSQPARSSAPRPLIASAACAGSSSRTAPNCANNCTHSPTSNRPSATACSIRRSQCSTTLRMSACCRSPTVTGRSGIGRRASPRGPLKPPRSLQWSATRSTRPGSTRSGDISGRPHDHGGTPMPVTVKTFATSREAAAALSSERDARYLGGGTLGMRALNEGDVSVSTIVRATDRSLTHLDIAGPRITIGAGVTFARVLAERELAFLHHVAGSIGGPAVRNMGTIGGNLFAPNPFGDFTVALLALDATVAVQSAYGARDVPIEEFLAERGRLQGGLVLSVSLRRPSYAEAFRYRKIARIRPKGGSVVTLAVHLPISGGRTVGARIA